MAVNDPIPSPSGSQKAVVEQSSPANHGKNELTFEMAEEELPFSWPSWKKWWVLTVIFLVQTSMNFNTSLYSNGLNGIVDEFGVSAQVARLGATLFLILYAFGCELWAPWSEEFGRKPIMQSSLFLVNIFCLPVAIAPNFASIIVGRCLGGLSSAGGSVTLGMIADMFDAEHQQYAVAYIVMSSVGGSILGPIVGGFVESYLEWRWCMWIQLIFGGFVQLLHLFTVPETRTTVVLDQIAKQRRKKTGENIYGPNEINPVLKRMDFKEILQTWARPFKMFVTEPIVLTLSLLSGFSDALIFMQIQSFSLVYTQWKFTPWELGLAFIPIGIGYCVAYASFIPAIKRNKAQRAARPGDEHAQYESRLWWLLFTAPCLPIGLLMFALTCNGPPVHWIGSMFASGIIGIANYAIYMATIDYMVCAYGPFSASATGGNGFARDFLAGVLTNAATPFYENIAGPQKKPLQNASFILFAISCILVIWVYVIYFYGPTLRKRSTFAQTLAREAADNKAQQGHESVNAAAGNEKQLASQQHTSDAETPSREAPVAKRPSLGPGSRTSSYQMSRDVASRNASRNASRAHSFEEVREEAAGGAATEKSGSGTRSGTRSGTQTPGRTSQGPYGPGTHHVHHNDLENRLNKLGRIDSEAQ